MTDRATNLRATFRARMPAEPGRLRATAAALTLISGGLMMLAGYLAEGKSWTAARLVTVPGGLVILAALALAARADFQSGRTRGNPRSRVLVLMIVLLAGG